MEPFRLREARAADAARLAELITQLGYPASTDSMRARLDVLRDRPEFHTYVLEAETTVVGLAGVQFVPSYTQDGVVARIIVFVVDEAWRGRGVGRRLLTAVEERLRAAGASSVVVNSAHARTDAHRFYLACGYSSTGLRFGKSLS
ncbi:MAG TPA: GNAT family N-acetyltransferase [Candidatus Polarisedimenticolaceae bacterium]|nr:GNAT family N-acetyltransferase [Candidatus Polarisedimenticolaceae bacterium]